MTDITGQLVPVLPVRNTVIFPSNSMPINVGRSRSTKAVDAAKEGGGLIMVVGQREDHDGNPETRHLYDVGTLCRIGKVRGSASQGYQVLITALERVKVEEWLESDEYLQARITVLSDETCDEETGTALLANIKLVARDILALVPADTSQVSLLIDGIDDLRLLVHLCAEQVDASLEAKQELLEENSLKARAMKLLELMQTHKSSLGLQHEIREKVASRLGKHQREAVLREQLKAIREELGDSGQSGEENYESRIETVGMPEEVRRVAEEELRRLRSLGPSSPETHVVRNYLDLLCSMPWTKSSPDHIDLEEARSRLDADHYGLDKVKDRILQHLAVMKLRGTGRGSILLLVGPPGVGKTSLGASIAAALGREYVRASLGGVRDEAEIRGHRRTYIGAMPGRIIQGLKRSGTNNPVFVLDEIDKLGRSFAGDPSSALLEVLDPEQNSSFTDHYLDVPFDLSKVLFIATANSMEDIPGPLRDRMEVIKLSGYTTPEKLHIAKDHLISKQLKEHGLGDDQVVFDDEAVMRLISAYTREAGVRDLQRQIGTLCRMLTVEVLKQGADLPQRITAKRLEDLLGPEKHVYEVAEKLVPPGVVTGLAWTPLGGEILFIEARLMPGTGRMTVTGQLGEVMKESSQIALSLVRSNLATLVPGFEYDKRDLHIHVPAGAIPKDGPSAGVAMVSTIASLFTGRSIDPKLAMTGEITLRGVVMPVGGIKEKVLAAHRAGIKTILLPKRNEKDLREVPTDVKDNLQFVFVENVTDVLKVALGINSNFLPLPPNQGFLEGTPCAVS